MLEDFVLLDMEDNLNGKEDELLVILGKTFMATVRTKIDVQRKSSWLGLGSLMS